jgi:hypothetical protein
MKDCDGSGPSFNSLKLIQAFLQCDEGKCLKHASKILCELLFHRLLATPDALLRPTVEDIETNVPTCATSVVVIEMPLPPKTSPPPTPTEAVIETLQTRSDSRALPYLESLVDLRSDCGVDRSRSQT